VGAWLRIWTPPRDAYVPPIPWRKLALGTAVGALVIGIALAILVPRINTGKAERAAAEQAKKERAIARHRVRVTRLQRPQQGDAARLLPAVDASPAEHEAARAKLLDRVEAQIQADAEARAATGEMRQVDGPTSCEPLPGRPTAGPIVAFDCFTIARNIKRQKRTAAGVIGYPFRAIVDYRDYTYTWCKVEQTPGELLVQDPTQVVQLPEECRPPPS
jgi:hypothetical protein